MAWGDELLAGARWTEAEDVYLRANFPRMSPAVLECNMQRSYWAIKHRAKHLKVRRPRWSPTRDEEAYIRLNVSRFGAAGCAKRLGLKPQRVNSWCRNRGLSSGRTPYKRAPYLVAEVCHQLNCGKSNRQVAIDLGRTVCTIAGIRRDIKVGRYEGLTL